MATSKFNKVVKKKNITYTHLNMRNATNGFKTRKNVYRYANKSLVGGSANSVHSVAYEAFSKDVEQLIPASDAQKKVSSEEFNTPITIDNTQFPNNIILYAFIIFYCLKVHNFKINTTLDEVKKNKPLLTGLVNKLIEVLKNDSGTKHLTILEKNKYYDTKTQTTTIDISFFNILNKILHNGDTTKALATDNLDKYFDIYTVNRGFFSNKIMIQTIKINVEPKKNFLNNNVKINFNNTDASQEPLTKPIVAVNVATSSAKNDDTAYDDTVDKLVVELNKILTELNIPKIDISKLVGSFDKDVICNNSICSIFCNDKDNISLQNLTLTAFKNLIDKKYRTEYYNTINQTTQRAHAHNTLTNEMYASIYNNLLEMVLKPNNSTYIIKTFTQMQEYIKANRDKCDKFRVNLGTSDCKQYINEMYSGFQKQLGNPANKYETYKKQIDESIKKENAKINNNIIQRLTDYIVKCILNSYLMSLMYCCIIFYAIIKYKNIRNFNQIMVDPLRTNLSNVSENFKNAGLEESTYNKISGHINLDEIKKNIEDIARSIPIQCTYKNIYNMFVNNNNILLQQLIEHAFNKLIGENNNKQISKYYNAIKTILSQDIQININVIYDDDVKAYVYLLLLQLIGENNIYINIKSVFIKDYERINDFITRETLLTYIDNYYKDFTQILTKQIHPGKDKAYYENAITQDINSIKDTDTNTQDINSIKDTIDNIHNNIALYIINLYLQKFMYCCIILYAINRYENFNPTIQQSQLPNITINGKVYDPYGKVVPNNPNTP